MYFQCTCASWVICNYFRKLLDFEMLVDLGARENYTNYVIPITGFLMPWHYSVSFVKASL